MRQDFLTPVVTAGQYLIDIVTVPLPLLGPIPWPLSSGLASTVLAWKQERVWKLLRVGQVKVDLLNI